MDGQNKRGRRPLYYFMFFPFGTAGFYRTRTLLYSLSRNGQDKRGGEEIETAVVDIAKRENVALD